MTEKIRAEIAMSGTKQNPWDPAGYAWDVTLSYGDRSMHVDFFTGSMAGEPTGADVLECLVADMTYADNGDAWEAAAELGYDSVEDVKTFVTETYPKLIAQTRELERLLAGTDILNDIEGADGLADFVEDVT